MSKHVRILAGAFFGLAFAVLVAGSQVGAAQNTLTGEWKATVKSDESDKIQLSFERRR